MASLGRNRGVDNGGAEDCAIPALQRLHRITRLTQGDFDRQQAILGALAFLAMLALITAGLSLAVIVLEIYPLQPGAEPDTYQLVSLGRGFLLSLYALPIGVGAAAALLALSRHFTATRFQQRWDRAYRPARWALERTGLARLLGDDALWREALAAHCAESLVRLPAVLLPQTLEQHLLLLAAAWEPLRRAAAGDRGALRAGLVETLIRYSLLARAAQRGVIADLQARARLAATVEFLSGWGDEDAAAQTPQLEFRPLAVATGRRRLAEPVGYDYRLRAREDRVFG